MRMLLAASALLLAAAPGAAGPQSRDLVPAAEAVGAPIDCVTLTQVQSARVRDGATIDFLMRGGKVYRNQLDGGSCPQLSSEKRFLYKVSGGRLCSFDHITVLTDPGLRQGASCGLGEFQPVQLTAAH